MPEVLIRCPVTGKQLSTGIALDAESFARVQLEGRTAWCPHCNRPHPWSKRDAFLR